MLFERINQATADPLTGRIALFIAGALTTGFAIALTFSVTAKVEAMYLLFFILIGIFGIYLIARAFFRDHRAKDILLSYAFGAIGVICIVAAMVIAPVIRRAATILRG